MLGASKPLSKFIVLAHQQKDIIAAASVGQAIDDLVDIIKTRIQEKSIEEVAESIVEKVFDTRLNLLEWFVQEEKSLADYHIQMNEVLAHKLQLAPYSVLSETVALVLSLQEKIALPISEALNTEQFNKVRSTIAHNKISYDVVKLFALHPAPQVQCLKQWVNASLYLEFALMLSELVLQEKIKLSEEKIAALIAYLKTIITQYGAYSIFTGFWKPADNDRSHWTNRMLILATTMEFDNNIYYKSSKEELFHLIHN